MFDLDIVIPVYNEGKNIAPVIQALEENVKTSFRVLICYDYDEDDTLAAARGLEHSCTIDFVKNTGRGPHSAVLTGFKNSTAPAVLVYAADDLTNAVIVDRMVHALRSGNEIVAASRFMKGGAMEGCPLLKSILVRTASFTMRFFAGLPIHDATNGFRMFSRRVTTEIPIESTDGFTFSIELTVKAHRLRWPISEVPAIWRERIRGKSRFRTIKWIPAYLRWYLYSFSTRFLRRTFVELNSGEK